MPCALPAGAVVVAPCSEVVSTSPEGSKSGTAWRTGLTPQRRRSNFRRVGDAELRDGSETIPRCWRCCRQSRCRPPGTRPADFPGYPSALSCDFTGSGVGLLVMIFLTKLVQECGIVLEHPLRLRGGVDSCAQAERFDYDCGCG